MIIARQRQNIGAVHIFPLPRLYVLHIIIARDTIRQLANAPCDTRMRK
jgi:hypothetical protein